MSMSIRPLTSTLGAEVQGVDMNGPVDDATRAALRDAFERSAVVCIRGQKLEPSRLVDVARVFGRPEPQVNEHLRLPGCPEVGILSSDTRDVYGTGKRVIQGTTWHTDHSFTSCPPKATMLYALEIPATGGNTSFCDMRAAYAALPEALKQRVDGARAVHCYQSSRSPRAMLVRTEAEKTATPDVVHPLVRRNPVTGAPALYMSTTRLERIEGLDKEASDALIDELLAHATQARFQYHHVWRVGDVLVWDNRCLMHHANADYPLDARRVMHRVLIEGEQAA